MRTKGALFHPALNTYIENWGGYYLINKIHWMPNFGRFSRTPVFLTTKRGTRFDTLLSAGASRITWYEDWLRKCSRPDPSPDHVNIVNPFSTW